MQISSYNQVNAYPSVQNTTDPAPDSGNSIKVEGNYFNTRAGGFFTKSVFGGITGNQVSKIIMKGNVPASDPAISEGLGSSINRPMLLKSAGVNMGIGAAVLGGVSIIKQSIGLAAGSQDIAGAGANVITDVLRGGAAGALATGLGGLAAFGMRALTVNPTMGAIAGVIGGVVGANVGANLVEKTGLRDALLNSFGSEKVNEINYSYEKNWTSAFIH